MQATRQMMMKATREGPGLVRYLGLLPPLLLLEGHDAFAVARKQGGVSDDLVLV